MQHNLRYYKEQVSKYQITLPNLWAGIEPWTSQQLLRKYWALALKCNALEGKVVKDYGCVCSLDNLQVWDEELEHYEFVEGLTSERIEEYVAAFEGVNIEDWEVVDEDIELIS